MNIAPGSESISHKQSPHVHNSKHLMEHFHFPQFKHDHPPVVNVNELADEKLTVGQRVADSVATVMGSWNFIITQALIMTVWIILNVVGWISRWDVYPFVLLNLAMSAQAAFATPLIMMSQNRQSEKDRLTAQNDYDTDRKGEEEIRHIMEHLDHQDDLILRIVKRLEEQHEEMKGHLMRLDPELAQAVGSELQHATPEREQGKQ